MHFSDNRNPLIAYLQGSASEQERRQVERWMRSALANRELIEKLRAAPHLADDIAQEEGFSLSAFRRIPAGPAPAEGDESEPHDFVATPFRAGLLFLLAKAAAVLLILIPVYMLFEGKISALFDSERGTWVEVRTPAGETQVIELEQGNRIFLYEGSRLRHRPGFGEELYLDGVAAFEVRRQPLRIHVGRAEIRVTDAAFEVQELAAGQGVELIVEQGEVTFTRTHGDEPLFIRSPQRMTYAFREEALP